MIEWNDSLLVGFEPIDAEHKALVRLVGELYRRLKNGDDRALVEDALFEVADHVAAHFNQENDLMARSGYAGRADHLFEHRVLIDQLDSVLDRVDMIPDEWLLQALGFVERWFVDHVHDADAKLGAHLVAWTSPGR